MNSRSFRIPLTCVAAAVAMASPAAGQEHVPEPAAAGDHGLQSVDIKEWPVPWPDTRPRDPFVVSGSEVWFVGQRGDYIAKLDPTTGAFEKFDLEEGAGPHNLIVADNGDVWYAGNRAAHIGRLDPETGAIEKIAMPDPAARDPHTLVFDQAGDIWFTVQGGNFIGKLTRASENVDLIAVPTPKARPYGIEVAADGNVWAVLLGTNKLASIDPATMTLTEYELPRAEARPRRMGITSDGRVWYVDYAGGMLGAYDPAAGTFEEWAAPSGAASKPYGMAVDGEDRIWFVETGVEPNRFVGFDPETERFFAAGDVPSGGGTVRHMFYHAPTDTIWFGADTNTIGRAKLD